MTRWLLLLLLLAPREARAHEFEPGVLAIVELPPGGAATHRFRMTPPVDTRGPGAPVRARFPAGCAAGEAPQTLVCAPGAFAAPMALEGVARPVGDARVVVSLRRVDGRSIDRLVLGDEPFTLDGAVPASSPSPSPSPVAGGWFGLGARHLLGGPDHLAFLLGLTALVRGMRRLVLAVTAFSVGHAIALGLTASGALLVPAGPAEALIAASVALVAAEALREPRDTLARRAPAAMALLFGLVHGVGFASALGDRGLAGPGLLRALLGFHLGIEGAQLVAIGAMAALARAAARLGAPALLRRGALYAAGCLGAAWTLDRAAQMLGR